MKTPATKNNEKTSAGTISNRAGSTPFFQPKLTINEPGDKYEQEADQVADQVMRMEEGDAPIVQRMPLTPVSGLQRKCAECEKEEKEQVQRKETGGQASGKTAPSVVSNILSSGGGQPMDGGTRQFMESRFGQDFGQVRIHTGGRAAESAAAIQARAYTSGRDIVFGKGEYQPGSEGGRKLLAHELVHVGQQGGADNQSKLQRKDAPEQGRVYELLDEDRQATRTIREDNQEFQQNYIDKNIVSVDYWSTPYAREDAQYRRFWVNYLDGRQLDFSLDDITPRQAIRQQPGFTSVRTSFHPRTYTKRNGFIFPDHYGEGSTPRLIDIVTNIAFHQRQREQFLETSTVTFYLSMTLAQSAGGLAGGVGTTNPFRSSGRIPFPNRLPTSAPSPPVASPSPAPGRATRPQTSIRVPETGTLGSQGASARAAAGRGTRSLPALTAEQSQMVESLLREHPGLVKRVAVEAVQGAKGVVGAGGRGADIRLLVGGGREVTVFTGKLDPQGLASRLITKASQQGVTEIYVQVNSPGASRQVVIELTKPMRRTYLDLADKVVRFFGPNGEGWITVRFMRPL